MARVNLWVLAGLIGLLVACGGGDDPPDGGDGGDTGADSATGDGGDTGTGDGAMGDGGDAGMDGGDGAMGDGAMGDGAMGDGGDGGDGGDTGPPPCTTDVECEDGSTCTIDTCDVASGVCTSAPVDSACDDTLFCNGAEVCDPSAATADATTGCVAGTAPVCDDAISCTTDSCDEDADTCNNALDDTVCDDATFCTGVEVCNPTDAAADATTGCVLGTTPTCDDGFACTTDACDTTTDACVSTASDAACDDGLFCTGAETCSPTTTGADAMGCVMGSPVLCDDTFSCTDDVCDDIADACVSTPIHTVCDNGMYCDGTEICDPSDPGADARGCGMGTGITCASDGFTCTTESCDEGSDMCISTPDHPACGAGSVCTGASGTAPSGCEAGSVCAVDADCDDMNPCTGTETCVSGICAPGTPLSCADALGCTVDSCDPTSGCVNTPDDAACDNGVICDGVEICDGTFGCIAGTAPTCDDGVTCTLDSCVEAAGGCQNTIDDGICDDGVFCNGPELCSPTLDCRPGTPPSCDDGLVCTDDSCDATMDACLSVGVDSRCDDGAFCNGSETCTVGAGCTPGATVMCNDGIACSVDSCNEGSDACESVYDSTMCPMGEVCTVTGCQPGAVCTGPTASVCDDGLFCNGVETCSSSTTVPGVCQGGTAPDCDDSNACTVDSCSDVLGSCTSTAQDVDGDGFGDDSCGGTDCNDGDPAINPAAAEVCDGVDNDCDGSIDGGLGSAGALCSSGAECCSGSCASGICVDGPGICNLILDACTADSECCTGLCSASVDGVLRCQVPGGCGVGGTACVVGADCCSTGCVGGFCDDTVTCTDTGGSCMTNVECCTHNCVGGTCESAGPSCNVDGEECSSAGSCCSGFCFPGATALDPDRCSGHDTCRGEGQLCVTDGDCCHGGCDGDAHPDPGVGRCQFIGSCATSGEACTSVRGCCSALCVDAGSGVGICEFLPGCRPFGEVCSLNTDCCSDECGPPEGVAGIRRCVNPPGCVDAGEICGEGGSNNCCVLRSAGCTPTGLGVSRCNDQAMCIPDMGICDFSEQCCDGRLCILDPMGVRRCSDMCLPVGGTCLSNADCCEGRCLDGSCDDTPIGCIPFGGSGCTMDSDCCSGACLGGVCGISD